MLIFCYDKLEKNNFCYFTTAIYIHLCMKFSQITENNSRFTTVLYLFIFVIAVSALLIFPSIDLLSFAWYLHTLQPTGCNSTFHPCDLVHIASSLLSAKNLLFYFDPPSFYLDMLALKCFHETVVVKIVGLNY